MLVVDYENTRARVVGIGTRLIEGRFEAFTAAHRFVLAQGQDLLVLRHRPHIRKGQVPSRMLRLKPGAFERHNALLTAKLEHILQHARVGRVVWPDALDSDKETFTAVPVVNIRANDPHFALRLAGHRPTDDRL